MGSRTQPPTARNDPVQGTLRHRDRQWIAAPCAEKSGRAHRSHTRGDVLTDPYEHRRRWPRRPVSVECRIDGVSSRASVRLSELSPGGAYVDTSARFSPGDSVTVVVVLDGVDTTIHGRVIYTHAGMGFGMSFDVNRMPPDTCQRIEGFLATLRG